MLRIVPAVGILSGVLSCAPEMPPARTQEVTTEPPAESAPAPSPEARAAAQREPAALDAGFDEGMGPGEVVSGSPSEEERRELARLVQENLRRLANCYDRSLHPRPGRARLIVELTLKDGAVVSIGIVHPSGDDALDACIVRLFMGFSFPALRERIVVRYPFVFVGSQPN